MTEVDINRRRISQQPLRDTGMHELPVRLGTELASMLHIRILAEDQRIEYDKQLDAIKEGLVNQLEYDEDGRIVKRNLRKLRSQKTKAEAESEITEQREQAEEAQQTAEEPPLTTTAQPPQDASTMEDVAENNPGSPIESSGG